jgi:hypothetical protein
MSERCFCAAPDCPTCGPAQGWHVHTRRCEGADGVYACGQVAYGDSEPECLVCGAPSDTDICSDCQRQYEEEQGAPV